MHSPQETYVYGFASTSTKLVIESHYTGLFRPDGDGVASYIEKIDRGCYRPKGGGVTHAYVG